MLSWKYPLLSDEHVLELGNGCKKAFAQRGVRELMKEAAMGSFLVYRKRWMEKEQDQKLRERLKQHLQTMAVVNERCKWYCPVDGKEGSVLRKVCCLFDCFLVVFETKTFGDQPQERVIVAFRGTQDVSDVISDVSCSPGPLEGVKTGHAHRGFAQVANQIDVDAIIALAADHDVVLTGHSMGGAVALLVAVRVLARLEVTGRSAASIWDDIREQGHTQPSSGACMHFGVVTLGSPPPLCLATASSVLESRGLVLNVVDARDRVPFLFASVPCLPGVVCVPVEHSHTHCFLLCTHSHAHTLLDRRTGTVLRFLDWCLFLTAKSTRGLFVAQRTGAHCARLPRPLLRMRVPGTFLHLSCCRRRECSP